ncbi:MAG: hypothetical protein MZV64_43695 [Ignavibacteriales bacterium]|nr:hypothetical protein [Ignavibacteriales bacterium]
MPRPFGTRRRPSGRRRAASPAAAARSISRSWRGRTPMSRATRSSSACRSISTGCSRRRTSTRRRFGAFPSTGGWPRGPSSGPCSTGATGWSISSRRGPARRPTATCCRGASRRSDERVLLRPGPVADQDLPHRRRPRRGARGRRAGHRRRPVRRRHRGLGLGQIDLLNLPRRAGHAERRNDRDRRCPRLGDGPGGAGPLPAVRRAA